MVNIVRNLNQGLDVGANPMGNATAFVIGVGANPGAPNLDEEVRRFEYKVEAGAEYAVTQPVFDLNLLERFFREFRTKADEIGAFPNELTCLTLFHLIVVRDHAKHDRGKLAKTG